MTDTPIPNGRGWITATYSSYQNQQQMLERIQLLEITLALFITYVAAGNQVNSTAREALLHYAEHVGTPEQTP